MDTEQKKEKKPRCPNGTVRNKNGDCVKKPEAKEPKPAKEPKAAKEPKPAKEPKAAKEPKPAKEPKTVRKRVTAAPKGTLKKYAKILQERRKCIQLQFERLA